MPDGIEIHFDEKRGYLGLGCEPDAFQAYRELARSQLAEFPEIAIDRVVEINVVDTTTFVAWRDAPRRRVWDWAVAALILLVLVFAVIGVVGWSGGLPPDRSSGWRGGVVLAHGRVVAPVNKPPADGVGGR